MVRERYCSTSPLELALSMTGMKLPYCTQVWRQDVDNLHLGSTRTIQCCQEVKLDAATMLLSHALIVAAEPQGLWKYFS